MIWSHAREVAKAIAAFLSALAASLAAGAATSDGLNAGGTLVALIGAAAAGLLTFTVPNTPVPETNGAHRAN